MNSISVKLGDFEFSGFELPERLPFGGEQALAVQKLVGGKRVVNAMGRDDRPIEWSGHFLGVNALARAKRLDSLRVAGKALTLSWSEFRYRVVIASYRPDFEFGGFEIPFSISLTVISDEAQPGPPSRPSSIDQAISADMTTAKALGAEVGDTPLSNTLSSLDAAMSAVSSFATATQSTINSVLQPLADVQARVKVLTQSVGNTITNVATVGGVIPHSPVAAVAAKLNGQVAAMQSLPQLYNLQSVLGRMSGNLGSIGTSGEHRSVVGGNLFQIASDKYGDASEWTTIANANGKTDPQLSGLQTLIIPANADGSGGVLNT